MTTITIRFISLLLTALLVGTMFGIWLGFNPSALTAVAYVEMQQNAIRALNISLPALGAVCILLTATLAVLTKNDKRERSLLIAAVICLVTAGRRTADVRCVAASSRRRPRCVRLHPTRRSLSDWSEADFQGVRFPINQRSRRRAACPQSIRADFLC